MKISCTSLATVVLLAMTPVIATAYYVSLDYYVYANGTDGIPIMDDQTLQGVAYADGVYTKDGGYGNYGAASFVIDMMDRSVSASGHSHGVEMVEWPHFGSGTGNLDAANFYDRVTFTVPAGTYPDGLYVTMAGYMRGSVSSQIGAGSRIQLLAKLGSESHDTGIIEVGIDDSGTIAVDEDFNLELELVAPGTILNHDVDYMKEIRFGIWNATAWSVDYNTGMGYVTGDGDFDFTNGLRITSFTAPEGVRYVSQSGAFSDGVTGVPLALGARLEQNRPNPFNPATTIAFDLSQDESVTLQVFDVAGHLVKTLAAAEPCGQGHHEVSWRGDDEAGSRCASGLYFYRLEAGAFIETKRMMLVE